MGDKSLLIKEIIGYEGRYSITNDGKVLSHRKKIDLLPIGFIKKKHQRPQKNKWLKPIKNGRSGFRVNLFDNNGNSKLFFVHRLVGKAFIPNPNNKPQINHKNGNRLDNKIENLEWVTNQENMEHAVKNNLRAKGEKISKSKLTEQQVKEIRENHKNRKWGDKLYKKYNINSSTYYDVINNKTWKHV